MGPEESMQIQSNLASTIAMAFDECPSSVAEKKYIAASVERTTRWLKRCKDEMERLNSLPDTINPHQMLFGINQAGSMKISVSHMRKQITELDLDGYAVGGLAVGESHEDMYRILDAVVPNLPEKKPTYLMGVGLRQIFWRQWTAVLIFLTVCIRQGTEDTDMCIRIMES